MPIFSSIEVQCESCTRCVLMKVNLRLGHTTQGDAFFEYEYTDLPKGWTGNASYFSNILCPECSKTESTE